MLSKRLKSHLRREAVLADPTAPGDVFSSTQTNPYGLDYLCVVDFEATCEAQNPPDYIHEIIEFPVILLSLKTLTVVSWFSRMSSPRGTKSRSVQMRRWVRGVHVYIMV